MERKEILQLMKNLRSFCPYSGSTCSNVLLREKVSDGNDDTEERRENFELHLKWVIDNQSREFLKSYIEKNNLAMIETDKTVVIYTI